MKLYKYHQNNSGGYAKFGTGIGYNVLIEADSTAEADEKAEAIGLYFDGCDAGEDCRCCGDRWSRASDYDVKEIEALTDLTEYAFRHSVGGKHHPMVVVDGPVEDYDGHVVHLKDGSVTWMLPDYDQIIESESD